MTQARRVRLVLRRIEPWTVLKFSLLLYASLYLVLLVAAITLWAAASITGLRGSVESFVGDLVASKDFHFQGGELLRASVIGGTLLVLVGSGVTVLLSVLHNLISDLIGGFGVVFEEPASRHTSRRRAPEPPQGRATWQDDDFDAALIDPTPPKPKPKATVAASGTAKPSTATTTTAGARRPSPAPASPAPAATATASPAPATATASPTPATATAGPTPAATAKPSVPPVATPGGRAVASAGDRAVASAGLGASAPPAPRPTPPATPTSAPPARRPEPQPTTSTQPAPPHPTPAVPPPSPPATAAAAARAHPGADVAARGPGPLATGLLPTGPGTTAAADVAAGGPDPLATGFRPTGPGTTVAADAPARLAGPLATGLLPTGLNPSLLATGTGTTAAASIPAARLAGCLPADGTGAIVVVRRRAGRPERPPTRPRGRGRPDHPFACPTPARRGRCDRQRHLAPGRGGGRELDGRTGGDPVGYPVNPCVAPGHRR